MAPTPGPISFAAALVATLLVNSSGFWYKLDHGQDSAPLKPLTSASQRLLTTPSTAAAEDSAPWEALQSASRTLLTTPSTAGAEDFLASLWASWPSSMPLGTEVTMVLAAITDVAFFALLWFLFALLWAPLVFFALLRFCCRKIGHGKCKPSAKDEPSSVQSSHQEERSLLQSALVPLVQEQHALWQSTLPPSVQDEVDKGDNAKDDSAKEEPTSMQSALVPSVQDEVHKDDNGKGSPTQDTDDVKGNSGKEAEAPEDSDENTLWQYLGIIFGA